MRTLHPAPAERMAIGGDVYPTGESMSRDQVIRREELSAVEVLVSVQDLDRLLAGDTDPELVERVRLERDSYLERLYERRDFG